MSKRIRQRPPSVQFNDDYDISDLFENLNLNNREKMEALMQQLEERMNQITTNHAAQMNQLAANNAARMAQLEATNTELLRKITELEATQAAYAPALMQQQ